MSSRYPRAAVGLSALFLTGAATFVVGLPASAAPVEAASVSVSSNNITYLGSAQRNALTVTSGGEVDPSDPLGASYIVFQDQSDIVAGDGCSYLDGQNKHTVQCGVNFNGQTPPELLVDLGPSTDSATIGDYTIGTTLNGGDGNDRLTAGNSVGVVNGGSGDDTITADLGVIANGDAGDDLIIGSRTVGDTLNGGTGNDTIYGLGGSDKIYGNSGDDALYGGSGGDLVSGGAGNDLIYGNSGNDTLIGGAGTDTISGGTGRNKITQ